MPIGKFKNFGDCVRAQKQRGRSDEASRKICGFIEQRSKGIESDEELEQITAQAEREVDLEDWVKKQLKGPELESTGQ